MAEFIDNNIKNEYIGYMSFELNYGYRLHIFNKEDFNFYSNKKTIKKLLFKRKKVDNYLSI